MRTEDMTPEEWWAMMEAEKFGKVKGDGSEAEVNGAATMQLAVREFSMMLETECGIRTPDVALAARAAEEAIELMLAVMEGDAEEIGEEIADVMHFVLELAERKGLNVAVEFRKKLEKNWERKWEGGKFGMTRHA